MFGQQDYCNAVLDVCLVRLVLGLVASTTTNVSPGGWRCIPSTRGTVVDFLCKEESAHRTCAGLESSLHNMRRFNRRPKTLPTLLRAGRSRDRHLRGGRRVC